MKRRKILIHYLPVYGCFATGIIYVAIGIMAILSFLKVREGGADENRLIAFLNQFIMGKILIIIILAGTACYIVWRFYETFKDPYGYGKDAGGIAKRTGIALSTVADMLIVFAAVRFLFELGYTGEAEQLPGQRQSVENILQKEYGKMVIISLGTIVIITALIQLFYGVTRGFRERLEVEEFNPPLKKLIHFLGISGYFSRGIIIGIIGFFYISAGISENAQAIVDTDKAFDFIGDNIGHVWFILVAAGTIFYGLFMFALGVGYDIDKD